MTTLQDVSLKIARRGLRMFETVHVPILGVIENMSTFTCPHCGKDTDVFRSGGGERMSEQLGVPFLGAIPLDADIVTGGDEGRPMLLDKPDSVAAQACQAIATLRISAPLPRRTSTVTVGGIVSTSTHRLGGSPDLGRSSPMPTPLLTTKVKP